MHPPQPVEKVSPGLSRAAALDLQSRAATGAARAKSLAAQGFLCTERLPRHRRKRAVKSSIKWRCHLIDSRRRTLCVLLPPVFFAHPITRQLLCM